VGWAGMRFRPKDAFGDYHTYTMVVVLGMGLCAYGVNGSIQKFGAGQELNQRRLVALALRGLIALVVLGLPLAWALAELFGTGVGLAMISLPWLVMFMWGRFIVRSRIEAKYEARMMIVMSLMKSACIGAFISFSEYRDAMIYGDVLALILGGAATVAILPRAFDRPLSALYLEPVPRSFLREFLLFTRSLWVSGQLFLASQEIVGLFTAARLGAFAMGAYGGLKELWQFAFKPMDFLGQAALPALVAEEEGRRGRLYLSVVRSCLVVFPSIGVVLASVSPTVLDVLGIGEKFAEIPTMLIVLAAGVPATAVQLVVSQYAIAEGHPRFTLFSNLAQTAAIAVSIYPLTQMFHLDGLVLSMLLGSWAATLSLVASMWLTNRHEMRLTIMWMIRAFGVCFVALMPIYERRWEQGAWTSVFPAMGLYLVMLFVVRLLKPTDLVRAYRLGALKLRSGSLRGSATP